MTLRVFPTGVVSHHWIPIPSSTPLPSTNGAQGVSQHRLSARIWAPMPHLERYFRQYDEKGSTSSSLRSESHNCEQNHSRSPPAGAGSDQHEEFKDSVGGNEFLASLRLPAVLEFIPYRKNDGTAARDAIRMPFLASFGIVCLRVDTRGAGDSEGVLLDEYLPTELDDACAVIRWISEQPWSNGSVGMFGKSWGAFNALQVAALQPPALKAVIAVAGTDDRYAEDVHYLGGCLQASGIASWATVMLAYNGRPSSTSNHRWNASFAASTTTTASATPKWLELWKQRLQCASDNEFLSPWLTHRRRDAYWQHGSVCEDGYRRLRVPILAVGGEADGYQSFVFNLLCHAPADVPVFGLLGPWAHLYPDQANPGPAVAFTHESVDWWLQWLTNPDVSPNDATLLELVAPARATWCTEVTDGKEEQNSGGCRSSARAVSGATYFTRCLNAGIARALRTFVATESHLCRTYPKTVKGTWVHVVATATNGGSGCETRKTKEQQRPRSGGGTLWVCRKTFHGTGALVEAGKDDGGAIATMADEHALIPRRVLVGEGMGNWFGFGEPGEAHSNQRVDDACSLTFDSCPFPTEVTYIGVPLVAVTAESRDVPRGAHLVARLCEVSPCGDSRLLSCGAINTEFVDDGKFLATVYDAEPHAFRNPDESHHQRTFHIRMSPVSCVCRAGYRLRLALSETLWPILWPSPSNADDDDADDAAPSQKQRDSHRAAAFRVSLSRGGGKDNSAGCSVWLPHHVSEKFARDTLDATSLLGSASLFPRVSDPVAAAPLPTAMLWPTGSTRRVTQDLVAATQTLRVVEDEGVQCWYSPADFDIESSPSLARDGTTPSPPLIVLGAALANTFSIVNPTVDCRAAQWWMWRDSATTSSRNDVVTSLQSRWHHHLLDDDEEGPQAAHHASQAPRADVDLMGLCYVAAEMHLRPAVPQDAARATTATQAFCMRHRLVAFLIALPEPPTKEALLAPRCGALVEVPIDDLEAHLAKLYTQVPRASVMKVYDSGAREKHVDPCDAVNA